MDTINADFIAFLMRAKCATYAGGEGGRVAASRTASHDLAYAEGDWSYLDTYLGGYAFIGEEAVWLHNNPIWGMNYYGAMTVPDIPQGFSEFLKLALQHVPADAPYRGPAQFEQDGFTYTCQWEGNPGLFKGDEMIALDGQVIYTLSFHGGVIQS